MAKSIKVLLIVSVICLAIVAVVSCGKKALKDESVFTGTAKNVQVSGTEGADTDAKMTPAPVIKDPDVTQIPTATSEPSPSPTPTPKPYTVVLDPGHGGKDPGACCQKHDEADLVLTIAKYCRDYLLNEYDSIEVYMTRTEDVHLSADKVEDLTMRCEIAKEVGADCLVSIHLNASEAHKLHGAEIYVSRRDNVKEATVRLANGIMDELAALGIKKRDIAPRKSNDMFDENGVAYDYYAINRHCARFDIPGIIVEAGFLDNEADQAFLFNEEGLKAIGEAEARGIAHYLGADIEE